MKEWQGNNQTKQGSFDDDLTNPRKMNYPHLYHWSWSVLAVSVCFCVFFFSFIPRGRKKERNFVHFDPCCYLKKPKKAVTSNWRVYFSVPLFSWVPLARREYKTTLHPSRVSYFKYPFSTQLRVDILWRGSEFMCLFIMHSQGKE